ncbi:MAG: hypothetical protein J3T61_01280 [Candidatus Brocadiales bacterium]|nr:hypothetical protein [Candidatus Bathyanammoxibius sp.]
MFSLETIQGIQREAAARAAADEKVPFVVWEEDLAAFPPFPFPFLGDYVPPGWKQDRTWFVDSSGFGRPGEAALTATQFRDHLKVGKGYAIVGQRQFQVYVGEYSQTDG